MSVFDPKLPLAVRQISIARHGFVGVWCVLSCGNLNALQIYPLVDTRAL